MRACAAPEHAWLRSCAATLAEERVLHLVHAFKYAGLSSLAAPMAHAIAAHVPRGWIAEASVVSAVPLHRGRQRERGFNQAGLLARGVGDALGLPVDEGLLRRTRATGTQTRRGASARRGDGVRGAFALRDPDQVIPRTVLLVDDVLTTGATFSACAEVLREGGASTVFCAAFAEAV